MRRLIVMGVMAGLALISAIPARGETPEVPASLIFRLVRPDLQLQQILSLFDGARFSNPAAALAAWRRAEPARNRLGKGPEALIAAMNPAMVPELRLLDGAEVSLGFPPDRDEVTWSAIVPEDDGTFAAMAIALALTDGEHLPAIGSASVDRIGPPGSPLMASAEGGVALAGDRERLRLALKHLEENGHGPPKSIESGVQVRLEPETLDDSGPILLRRLAAALNAADCQGLDGLARLDGETFVLDVTGRYATPLPSGGAVNPRWLDVFPTQKTLGAVALTINPGDEAWDLAFSIADRIVKADPAQAGSAPVRVRLNLLARAVGVHPEADLWPHLRGLSAGITVDDSGELDGAILALHTADAAAASRMARELIPRLIAAFGPANAPPGPVAAEGVLSFGAVAGRSLNLATREATVLVTWGDGLLAACQKAQDHPETHSAGAAIRQALAPPLSQRVGAFWPGRLGQSIPEDVPLTEALNNSAPVLWQGTTEGATTHDTIRWGELRGVVSRFLDHLPAEEPAVSLKDS